MCFARISQGWARRNVSRINLNPPELHTEKTSQGRGDGKQSVQYCLPYSEGFLFTLAVEDRPAYFWSHLHFVTPGFNRKALKYPPADAEEFARVYTRGGYTYVPNAKSSRK